MNQDENGWTILTPSADTRYVYVSAEGQDSNAGTSSTAPEKSLARGVSLLRNGYPDWLLLRAGDNWINESISLSVSGRSELERLTITSYGPSTARPCILAGYGQSGISLSRTNHIAIVGLKLHAHTRDPLSHAFVSSANSYGIRYVDTSSNASQSNLLIEDCCISFFGTNVCIEDRSGGPLSNFQLRRSIIADAYANPEHSQGLFVYGVDGIYVEDNIFDHNGWYLDRDTGGIVGGSATTFNHNIYINNPNPTSPTTRDNRPYIIVTNNIILRAAASGIQLRSGGTLTDNLFAQCGGAMLGGRGTNPEIHNPDGVDLLMRDNVVLEGLDTNSSTPAGRGIWLGNVRNARLASNIIAHIHPSDRSQETVGAILEGDAVLPSRNISLADNIFYSWPRGAIQISGQAYVAIISERRNKYWDAGSLNWPITGDNQRSESIRFTDPSRSLAAYNQTLGGQPTFDSFAAQLRLQSKSNWRPEYTARAVNEYIRQGFSEQGQPTMIRFAITLPPISGASDISRRELSVSIAGAAAVVTNPPLNDAQSAPLIGPEDATVHAELVHIDAGGLRSPASTLDATLGNQAPPQPGPVTLVILGQS